MMLNEHGEIPERSDWQSLAASLAGRFVVVEHEVPLAGRGYRLLKPRSPDELISEEDFNRDERLPYWADVWPSALCLAERVAAEAGQGRRFLELGCGIGYVCAVAVDAGFAVLATDYYAESLEFTWVNARRNGLAGPATKLVDWRAFPEDLGRFDLVAAADVLYEKDYPALVAAAFGQTLAPAGLGLVADPGRRGAAPFVEECAARGLAVRKLLTAPFDNGSVCHTVDLYELRWQK
ncbi:MAG TPA: methyltransferase domain-containing protein [Pirellulales bacterium]|nr:methyltransferase domain-containing protein [Pirellulales bacterium]